MARLLRALLGYAILIVAVAGLWERPLVLLGALIGLVAAMLAVLRSRRAVAFFLTGATLGPAAEAIAIAQGAWKYAATENLIPFWLPLAWGMASVLMDEIVEALVPSRTQGESTKHARRPS